MNWNVISHEYDFGRFVRISITEFETQLEVLSSVKRILTSLHLDLDGLTTTPYRGGYALHVTGELLTGLSSSNSLDPQDYQNYQNWQGLENDGQLILFAVGDAKVQVSSPTFPTLACEYNWRTRRENISHLLTQL